MNEYLKLSAASIGVGEFFVLLLTWFTAFISPSQAVVVYINKMGEMWWEFVILPIAFGFCFVVLATWWWELWHNHKTNRGGVKDAKVSE